MIELPQQLYFRRGQVRRLFGFSEEAMTKLVRSETLRPHYFAGDKHAYFARQDLVKLLPSELPTPSAPSRTCTPPKKL